MHTRFLILFNHRKKDKLSQKIPQRFRYSIRGHSFSNWPFKIKFISMVPGDTNPKFSSASTRKKTSLYSYLIWLKDFHNKHYTELAQLIVSFCLGVLFSPWTFGPLFYIVFILVYEIICGYVYQFKSPFWNFSTRIGIIFSSLFGFLVGRILIGYDDPFS